MIEICAGARRRFALLLIGFCFLVPVWAYAGQPQTDPAGPNDAAARGAQAVRAEERKTAVVTAITSEITVDGVLDEDIWRRSPTIGEMTQRDPVPGGVPTENTQVTLLHDGNNLYIGVQCADSEADRVIGTLMARDAVLNTDDRIEILLDTYRDQRNAFFFSTNPAGALVDGLVFANGQINREWDAIWTVRTRRNAAGWSAEFAIPFKSLSFPADRSVWGFNISRVIQRKLEEDVWSQARLEVQFTQVSEAGEITNLQGLTQGVGFDVRPFMAGRWFHRGTGGSDTVNGKPGLDMFYNVTPSLKLTATINTDFGETEVDARQINLTRFSLFFPEKRSFFLEDAGVFSFASTAITPPGGIPTTGADVIPFFSRQIGLLAGEEVPIDVGVKMTGKVGRTDIGVLDVRTRDVPAVSDKNFFIGRVKRNILQQSYVGALFTEGHPGLPLDSRTIGGDLRLATSRFLGTPRNFAFNAFAVRSVSEDRRGRDMSYGVSADYPNQRFVYQFAWSEIQENFRPALGFVQRRNVRLLRFGAQHKPRPRDFLDIQEIQNAIFFTHFTRLDNGETESWDLYLTPTDWHWRSGDSIHRFLSPNFTYERLFAPFQIFPGVVLPPGEYRSTRYRTSITSASKRKLSGSLNWAFGTYWSGHAHEVTATVTYKVPPRFTISLTSNQTFAELPQREFVARILSSQVNFAASPFLSFSNLIQYDNLSRNLGWQSRMRWIVQPGNDLFLVFTQGWIQNAVGGFRFDAHDSKVSTKLQYTARF
jgi:hypothetical protein